LTKDIYLEAGEFAVVCFEGRRNARLEISAWEIDRVQFDILLVAPTDIMEDRYREERALLAEYYCQDFQETYTFDRNQRLCLVISNTRATSRDKLVKLKLSWVLHDDDQWPVKKAKKPASTGEATEHKKAMSPRAVGYCVLLFFPITVALVLYFAIGDPVVVSVATAITSIIVAIFKDEIRDSIGLSR